MGSGKTLHLDSIGCDEAVTLPGLFRRRIEKSPDAIAYKQYDHAEGTWRSYTWQEMGAIAGRLGDALAREGLIAGDRVALLLKNSVEWVSFDQAALSLGLVVVSLYTTDNPGNNAYILEDSESKLLLVENEGEWNALKEHAEFPSLGRVLCLTRSNVEMQGDARFKYLDEWLPEDRRNNYPPPSEVSSRALATIIYSSGTTGRPKGVMLSHHNLLWNTEAVLRSIPGYREDVYLSFLPLSHAFERTVGYYLPVMAGSCVAYARSIQDLPEDLLTIRPTMLVSVPRIFERIHAVAQHRLKEKGRVVSLLSRLTEEIGWRRFEALHGRGKENGLFRRLFWRVLKHLIAEKVVSRFGGKLRIAVSGGAPLSSAISRFFIGLGVPLLQGYGLTEAGPVVSANRPEGNMPASVGEPLVSTEIRIGRDDELLVRSPGVMMGYWKRPEETRQAVDGEGWLHTGDQAEIVDNHIFIRGRLKDIIVTSTGKKVPPTDMEMRIVQDPLFDQAMVIGEGKPYIAALIVLNRSVWETLASVLSLDPDDNASLDAPNVLEAVLDKIRGLLHDFPSHAQVRAVRLTLFPWNIENGLITPTMKLKRPEIEKRFSDEIKCLYAGHDIPA